MTHIKELISTNSLKCLVRMKRKKYKKLKIKALQFHDDDDRLRDIIAELTALCNLGGELENLPCSVEVSGNGVVAIIDLLTKPSGEWLYSLIDSRERKLKNKLAELQGSHSAGNIEIGKCHTKLGALTKLRNELDSLKCTVNKK